MNSEQLALIEKLREALYDSQMRERLDLLLARALAEIQQALAPEKE
jgi:hypothetical protein